MKSFLKRALFFIPFILFLEYLFVLIPEIKDYMGMTAEQCVKPELVAEACSFKQAAINAFQAFYAFNMANFWLYTLAIALLFAALLYLVTKLRKEHDRGGWN
jgi:hypothetical protein